MVPTPSSRPGAQDLHVAPRCDRWGGIFCGMFSANDPDTVLAELGDKVVTSFIRATDAARVDIAVYRRKHPDWNADWSKRGLANWIHDRLWAHLSRELYALEDSGVTVVDREPVREVIVQMPIGRGYRLRFKRHSARDAISSYPTASDIAFWGGSGQFEDMEEINLAAGYRWDEDTGEIGATVLSYREGKSNPLWVIELVEGDAASVRPFTWAPIEPTLPQIDLERAVRLDEEGQAESL